MDKQSPSLYSQIKFEAGEQNAKVYHPEGTSNGSDICDFLKVYDFNGSL